MSKKNRWQKRFASQSSASTQTSVETNEISPAALSGERCLDGASEKTFAANRANAQLSTGPRTAAGLAKSSLNALKCGLTGRTVLLPTEDVAEYEQHIRRYHAEFSAVGQRETDLVQSIAETAWRLKRIPLLESSIYAVGSIELAEEYQDYDADMRPSMIQLAVHLKYEKQIRNLQLQESRLVRRREKEIAELRQLQEARQAQDANRTPSVSERARSSIAQPVAPVASIQNGFEFSNAVLEHMAAFENALTHSEAA
jgi:hypothetical protein